MSYSKTSYCEYVKKERDTETEQEQNKWNANYQHSAKQQKDVRVFMYCVQCPSVWYHLTDKRETEIKRWRKKERQNDLRDAFSYQTHHHTSCSRHTCIYTLQMSLIYMKITHTNQTNTQSISLMSHRTKKRNENVLLFIFMFAKGNPFNMPCIMVTVLYRAIIVLQCHRFCSLIASYS